HQEADEDGDDRNDDQQFDQRERATTGHETMLTPDASGGNRKTPLGGRTDSRREGLGRRFQHWQLYLRTPGSCLKRLGGQPVEYSMLKDDQFVPLSEAERQLYGQLVPQDHFLRRLLGQIDFERFRPMLSACYDSEQGRPPWDPVAMLKLELLARHYNLSD